MLDFVYRRASLARQPHLQTPILSIKLFVSRLCTEPSSEEAPAAVPSKEEPAASNGTGSGGTPEDLIAWFNTTVKDYDALFLIYYRGLW